MTAKHTTKKARPRQKQTTARGPGRPSHGASSEHTYPETARVIKRYGNRRLYDAKLSRCVTMGEIAEMVRNREDVRVVDGDNGEDLTKRVLVQIILEQQNTAALELLPVELLHQIISVRSQPLASWLGEYLQAGAEFVERQAQSAGPAMRGVTDSLGNLFPWLKPESWSDSWKGAGQSSQSAHTRPAASSTETMRQELADLQARFADLSARLTRP